MHKNCFEYAIVYVIMMALIGGEMKKVAIITGASSGIGLASAKTFLSKGWTVYGVARREFKGDFECFQADVNDSTKMKEIMESVYKKEGRIDAFVNNAGFGIGGELLDSDIETVKRLFSTNLTSYTTNLILVGNIMKKQGFGKIINICSLSGAIYPLPYQACYSVTKAGIDVLSRTARTELKPYNIYVSEVLPSDVKTGFSNARVINKSANEKVNQSLKRMEGYEQTGMSPNKIAKHIVRLAEKKRPRARAGVGAWKILIPLVKILPTRFVDWLILKIYC